MKLSDLREWLSAAKSTVHSGNDNEKNNSIDDIDSTDSNNSIIVPPFEPTKRLRENDYTILDMLHSAGHENVSFCITDPHLPDNPVIYISEGFVRLTGYEYDEVVGKNCRFLQGPETEEQDRKRIFDAVKTEKECSVNLLNYKKDGTKFVNEFFLTQLRTENNELAYHIGIQVAVNTRGRGQMPSNPGWIYSLGNHV